MKTLKPLFAVLLFIVCGNRIQAQLLKKLKEKVEQAVEKSVDKAANKATDKILGADLKKSGKKQQSSGNSSGNSSKQTTSKADEPFVLTGGTPPKIGDLCTSKEELAVMPGQYQTAEEHPWPAVRAEYFKKMTTASDKATAKQTLEQIQKLEQQSRANFELAGGFWEGYYSSEGYHYLTGKKLADYRFQTAFHEYICIKSKVVRNSEYSTVLRVYANTLPVNSMSRHLSNAFSDNLKNYAYKDWKSYKAGAAAPKIELLDYLAEWTPGVADAVNSDTDYWQDIPENEIRHNTYDFIYRYWFVKKAGVPLLLPVSRKEYLESLLEYYDREAMALPKSSSYESGSAAQRQKYFGDLPAVLANKKAIVNKVLKENSADWLSKQAVINPTEDVYQNQKQNLPEYSSELTFHRFYDNEKRAGSLYKYNPAYFSGNAQTAANPQFMTVAFRYVSMPVHRRLLNNFTENFDTEAWRKLLR